MRSTARTYLRVLLALSLVQQLLFRRLLLQGPGGKLMSCLIKPCMREEPLWAGLGVFLGCVFNAGVVSTITAIIVSANVSVQDFEEQLLRTNEYMRTLHLPSELRDRIRDYY